MTLCWQPKTHLVLSQNASRLPRKVSWCSMSGVTVTSSCESQTKVLNLEVLLEKEEFFSQNSLA